MNPNNLLDYLTDLITDQLASQAKTKTKPHPKFGMRSSGLHTTRGGPSHGPSFPLTVSGFPASQEQPDDLPKFARTIALKLLEDALKSGLPFDLSETNGKSLKGGNTAGLVAQIGLNLNFVFKFELNDEALLREAQTMRAIKNDAKLSEGFRNAWATVYAIYENGPPYAYLMEFFPPKDGWQSLESRLYAPDRPTQSAANEWANTAVNLLFDGYRSSVEPRIRPNLLVDYGSRIAPRLEKTEALGAKKLHNCNWFASRPLCINGTLYKPWREYLALLARHADYLDRITPAFSTVVHGDPNPGNFMLKLDSPHVLIKLIDPKDWGRGDYLLDLAKLSHFLQVIGPVEYAEAGKQPIPEIEETADELIINYHLQESSGLNMALDGCMEKLRQFAEQHGDTEWQARHELAMAANLLGLPLGRLGKDRQHEALIFLAEGIIWLDLFCERLEPGFRHGKCVYYAPPDTFEPTSFQQERAWVQQRIADITLSQSPRGYEQLQWPLLAEAATKPLCKLSFDHHAHFCCGPTVEIGTFLSALAQGERAMKNFLSDSKYMTWSVKRDAQSQPLTLRYYDYGDQTGTLINRQISLCESCTADATLAAWELEMPYVALGATALRARLAYHWCDNWQQTRADCLDQQDSAKRMRHPLALAAERRKIDLDKLTAVMQQTIYRESFLIKNAIDDLKFAIHIDHGMAQDLGSGRIGSYVAIQIDALASMDEEELPGFANFAAAVAKQYQLLINPSTTAQRGASAAGMMARP